MWKYQQEDGAVAVRIMVAPNAGHVAICKPKPKDGHWMAYFNDDHVNRTGEIALYADSKEDLIEHVRTYR